MFYFGTSITVTSTGNETKLANCDHCGEQYGYVVERTAKGNGHAPFMLFKGSVTRGAEKQAAKKLEQALKKAYDPVPCPNCARYPTSMAKRMKKDRFSQLWNFAIGLLFVGPVFPGILYYFLFERLAAGQLGGMTRDARESALTIAAAAAGVMTPIGLLVFRRLLIGRYDPNGEDSRESRTILARRRSYSLSPSNAPAEPILLRPAPAASRT
jgi:hypothetical protein